jgi:hypothetical protein
VSYAGAARQSDTEAARQSDTEAEGDRAGSEPPIGFAALRFRPMSSSFTLRRALAMLTRTIATSHDAPKFL